MAHVHYDSFSKFMDVAEHGSKHARFQPTHHEWNWSMGDDNPNHRSQGSLKDALELARFGWANGLSRVLATHIKEIEEYINPVTRLDVRYMDAPLSGMLDISRVLEGDPDCWQEYEMITEPSPKIIRLLINLGTSGGVSSSVMIKNGCALMGIIDAIESRGTRCEVAIAYAGSGDTVSVTVKQSDQYLDRENLIYAIAHPSTFRWLMRAVWGTNWPNKTEWGSTSIEDLERNPIAQQYDIVTPRSLLDEIDQGQSVKWMLAKLKSFGLEIATS